MVKTYLAPWGSDLILMSSLGTVVLVAVTIAISRSDYSWTTLIPVVLLCGAALFPIRGYSATPDAVLVHRLLWTTRLPLADLESVQFEPGVMAGGLRTFGNGGLFSFSGWFHNKTLGTYRAFVTDPSRTVVLRFRGGTVVVSPSSPEDFIEQVTAAQRAL